MDFTNDERFDGLYLNVAQTTRGIDPLLDTVFSFLRRKTDFFHGPNGQNTDAAVQKVNQVLLKHVEIYKAEQEKKDEKIRAQKAKKKEQLEKKKRAAEAEAKRKKEEEDGEDIIELGADGFDISDSKPIEHEAKPAMDAKPPKKAKEEPVKETPKKPKSDSNDNGTKPKEENADQDDESSGLKPNKGNGATIDGKYTWTQTLSELNVIIDVPENTRGRDLHVEIKKQKLKAALKSNLSKPIVDAPLSHSIICDDSFWTVEDGNRLVINLQKLNQMEWWDAVCIGDEKIDVKQVQPENSSLNDLDGDTRQTVEKMMFDQRQKSLGLPTSDEQRKFEALEKFKKAHPEMDFSNAKIS